MAREAIRRRLEGSTVRERAGFRAMQLHERLDFILNWLQDYSKHFSMAWIARRIGVSRQAISKVRKGESVPQQILIPLAEELGVGHRFLTDGIVDYPAPALAEEFFARLPAGLVQWVLADEPGRQEYVRTALEVARAAEARNIDLRFLEHVIELYQRS